MKKEDGQLLEEWILLVLTFSILSVAVRARTHGFGTLEQKVNERSREDYTQFDISANIDAGKLLPRNFGLQIPIYAWYQS